MNTVYLSIYLKSYRHGNTPQQCPISHIFPIWYNAKKHLYSKVSIPEELSYCRLSGGGALRHNPARNWLFLSWTRVSIFFFVVLCKLGGKKGRRSEGGGGVWETPEVSFSLTASQWEIKGFPVGGGGGWVCVGGVGLPETDPQWLEVKWRVGTRWAGPQLERNQHRSYWNQWGGESSSSPPGRLETCAHHTHHTHRRRRHETRGEEFKQNNAKKLN